MQPLTPLMRLYPRPPYDFARTAAATRFLFVMAKRLDGALRRTIRVGEALALIEVTNAGTADDPALDVALLASRGEIDPAALTAKVRRVLNVDADLAPFYAYARQHPALWQTVAGLYGLHGLQADTVFEGLLLTMIEQQITLKMAQTAERWLLDWGDEAVEYEGERYFTFPRPDQIAAATLDDLAPLKITFARIGRMIDLAKAITADALDLEGLRDQPLDDVYRTLIGIKGVGHWTAAWTITRGLGRYGYVGSADVALRAAVHAYYYGETGRAPAPLVDETFAQHRPFDGAAAFYTLMRWAFERY